MHWLDVHVRGFREFPTFKPEIQSTKVMIVLTVQCVESVSMKQYIFLGFRGPDIFNSILSFTSWRLVLEVSFLPPESVFDLYKFNQNREK